MSKTRQNAFPDGKVWIRTHPLTHLHDHATREHAHEWHQLTYAARGNIEITTRELRALVPPDRAVFVPSGMRHVEAIRAPVTVRTLYFAPGALAAAPARFRTIAVSALLRELIEHISGIGALDRAKKDHAHLTDVLLDLCSAAPDVPLQLPLPRDPRARAIVALIEAQPNDPASIAHLAQRTGASLRTIERCFLADTNMRAGEWRRRFRLFLALRLLNAGASVTEVAFDVGYASVSAFSAAFTRQFGVAPSRR
jgi:AraC-like DNA-binding protein